MEKHLTIVAALRIGNGLLALMAAATILLVFVGSGILAQWADGDEEALVILTAIAIPFAFVFFVSAALDFLGGIGILRRKNWARYLVMVHSVLDLFNIPIGTALGIYCIWALAHDETARMFRKPAGE
jgi:hypothetical protein